MSQKKTETPEAPEVFADPVAPETVELMNEYGWTAHPLKADEETWLAAGWKRAEPKPVKE